jgi:hypothetical protein
MVTTPIQVASGATVENDVVGVATMPDAIPVAFADQVSRPSLLNVNDRSENRDDG